MYIGVDLGGTKIAVAVVDPISGAIVSRDVAPTNSEEGPAAVLERMVQLIRSACGIAGVALSAIQAIGVGVPGVFDLQRGETLFLPNLVGAWLRVPVGATLGAQFNCPVWLINDARAFILAEATFGAGRGAPTVVGLTLGTGVGGGIAIGGKLYIGTGAAGEIGHMTINPDGPPCTCGNYGCIETYASGTAIAARGADAAGGRSPMLATRAAGDPARITPEDVRQAAEAGDPVAQDILWNAGRMLGVAVANLVTILSPDCVILGGSVARLGEWLFDPVRRAVHERVRAVPLERLAIVPAQLADSGVIGAARWGWQQTQQD
jgi:glucokinase